MEKKLSLFVNKLQLTSMKIQMFHWNVTGKDFLSYHAFFDEAYKELSSFKDSIAEFLRYKKLPAILDFNEIAKLSKGFKLPSNAFEMLKETLALYKELEKDLLSMEKGGALEVITSEMLAKINKKIFFVQSIIENY
jgi:starvation-inducible DNA-binding protein